MLLARHCWFIGVQNEFCHKVGFAQRPAGRVFALPIDPKPGVARAETGAGALESSGEALSGAEKRPGEPVIDKRRSIAFWGTDLAD